MAKYEPLRRYLSRQKTMEVCLTFTEVERIIGAMLPKSAQRPQWWANETAEGTTHVQVAAWRDVGFKAFLAGAEEVRFEKSR